MSDPVLDGYGEWVNEWVNNALFAAKLADGECLMWLESGRWMLAAPQGPEVFLIEIRHAEVKVAE
jgi:hypothetical protein